MKVLIVLDSFGWGTERAAQEIIDRTPQHSYTITTGGLVGPDDVKDVDLVACWIDTPLPQVIPLLEDLDIPLMARVTGWKSLWRILHHEFDYTRIDGIMACNEELAESEVQQRAAAMV